MPFNIHIKTKQLTPVLIGIPSLLIGGTEIQTLHLLRALTDLGYRVFVACYFEWDSTIVEQYRKAGAIVLLFSPEAIKKNNQPFKWQRPTGWAQVYFLWINFRKALLKYRPEMVHVQYLTPGALPVLLFRLLGVRKLFATVHQSGTPHGKIPHFLLKGSAAISTRFTGISKQVLESWFGNKLPKNVVLLYNTIDDDKINCIQHTMNVGELKSSLSISGKKVIGTVARLSQIKGIDLLLDAFSLIYDKEPDAILVIVGDGTKREELYEQACRLDINDRIIWAGVRSPDEVITYMQMFDICVCPSRYEGFGLTALEALSSSVPVVAFRVGGLPEVVEDHVNGMLVSPENIAELACTCVKLLGNESLRRQLAKKGKIVVRRYGYDAYKQAVGKLYNLAPMVESVPILHQNTFIAGVKDQT